MASKRAANQNQEEITEEVDGIEEQYDLPHTISLVEPIKWGDETRETLVIQRRLKAKDFKGMRATDLRYDDMLRLISKASGEPITFVEELDAKDMGKASKVIQSFL
jgi:hypothetical protein